MTDRVAGNGAARAWRPYSLRAALIRKLVPNVEVALPIGDGHRLTINVRTHLGLVKPAHRRREVATAKAMAALVPAGGVIYDIGANIGLYTVVFATSGARQVVSFEPSSLVLASLRRNVALNHLDNVFIESIVVSDRSGHVRFTLDATTTCTSHVSADGESGIDVPCARLDDIISSRALSQPDLIKLDVEGHDVAIVRGMTGVLSRKRPIICLEGGLRSPSGEIESLRLLQDSGYSLWNLARTRRLGADTSDYVVVGVPGGV